VSGRVPDCYLGLRLDPADDVQAAGVLVVAPAALLHPVVPQPDGTVLYELLTGHPDRTPGELVFIADLTVELRAWPTDTWAKLGVDPQAAAGAVIAAWRGGDLNGLQLDGLTGEEALALKRPAMTYVRGQLGDRLQRQLARAYRRWLHPTSGRRPGDASCGSGHPQTAAVSAVDSAVRTPGRGSAARRTPDTAVAVQTAQPDMAAAPIPHRRLGPLCRSGTPIMLTALGGGRDLRQQRSRGPRPAARRTSCHLHGGDRTGHHVSALAAGIR
jgi:hypothetical protein